ncbi:MAG: YcxB family protein [Pirellulales bacterium]|nr:YcxB family protein [Pirellulales bacterium]
MIDPNPYQPPCEPEDLVDSSPLGVWPKTATAVLDADMFVHSLRFHARAASRTKRLIVAIAFFVTFSAILSRQLGYMAMVIGAVAGVLLWFLSFLATPVSPRAIRKQLREMGKERETIRYEITPEAIRMVTEESDSRIPWNRFIKWRETDGLILAYRSSRFFILLPVDQFAPDARDAVRQGLRANVAS